MTLASRGKVPVFTLRPHPVVSLVLVLVLIAGLLLALSFFSFEDGTGEYQRKGVVTLILTAIISICLALVATSKLWFSHLWRKNATHERHKHHSQHHPGDRDHDFRRRRR